jgi:microsomal dipeptidase-like Zn-dependent dipeptidase
MTKTTKRRVLGGVVGVLTLATLFVFFVLPAQLEKHFNHTLHAPPYAASDRARALHAKLTIVDLHADTLLWDRDLLARGTRGHVDVPRLIEGNVALQAFTIVTKTPRAHNIDANDADTDNITLLAIAEAWPPRTWTSLTERALYQASKLEDAARRSNGKLTVIRTASDLSTYLARRSGDDSITAAFLGVEGAQALDENLDNLDRLFDAGVRMMAPTHFSDNDLGGSASGAEKIGLTAKGKELVRRMEAKRMLVDLAHASPRTIDDVLAVATRPVVVSHTGVRGTCDNARNLTDRQLAGIAKTGGVIGIGYWTHAICVVDAASIARAIHHAVRIAGIDHVALGSDFDGTTTTPFDVTGLVQLTDALLAEGFTDEEIGKIMGANTLRVLAAGLPR